MARRSLPTVVAERVDEIPFMRHVMGALGQHPLLRIWRQNTGKVPVRDRTGKVVRIFDPGVPNGAADVSGITSQGYRLELEFKADDGEQSDEQKNWQRMITLFGGIYELIEYDASRSLEDNVAAAVAQVERAIVARHHH